MWGQSGSITFDFEADGAHRASGSNAYSNNSYSQNGADISMTYFDAISNSTISGSYLARGRVAKNTTNSPVLIIGPIDITNKTITGIEFKTKGPNTITEVFSTKTDDAAYSQQLSFTCSTSTDTKTVNNLSITGTSLYLKWTGSVSSSTGSNRDFDVDDIVVTYTTAAPSYTITAASNNDSWGTVSLSGSVITATPNSGYRVSTTNPYTISPAGSAAVSQNGNAFTVTPSANTTVTINFEAIPTYTVTFSDGGSVTEATGGAGVTLPSRSDVGSYTFAGWSTTNVSSETTTAPTIIPAGTYHPTANITLYPVYTKTEGGGTVNNTASVTISDYATANSWSNSTKYETVALDANVTATGSQNGDNSKYYSNGNDWRFYASTNPKGVVTISTTSGTLNSVTLTYSGTFTYGGNSVTSGTAVNVSGTSAEFTCTANAKITAISVNYTTGGSTTYYWSSPVAATVEQPVIIVAENPFLFSTTATITCATEGASIKYSYDNSTWNDYSSALTITESKTIYAKAVKGENESTVASVTATKNLATPTVTVSGDLTVDLAGETNVNAGTLTAAVTYNDAAVAGATVTWSSSDPAIASIGENTGVVTLNSTGEVTFTATYAGNNDYASATGTKTITVVNNDPNAITLWSEDFSLYSANDVPTGGTYGYACTDGTSTSSTKIQAEYLAGGTSPELMVAKSNGTFTAVVPLNNASGSLTLTYKTNAHTLEVSTTTTGINGGGSYSDAGTHTVTFTGVTTSMKSITIKFTSTSSSNVRLDDILLVGRAEPAEVEAPTFSVNSGTYYTAQSVELSCATDGATIYYTTNGDEPTSSSTEYTSAISVTATMTIKAIAVKGSSESSVSSATYTIAEKNNVVFNISNKSIAYGETYTVTRGTSAGRDVQTDGYVTLSSSNDAVASVEGLTITANAVGTATITLSAAEGDTYKSGSTTVTVTITEPAGQTTAPAVPALFNETFDLCNGSGGRDDTFSGNVGTSATTDKLDESWTTISNNGAYQCIKLGTSNNSGTVTTSNITLTGNGTLTYSAAGWGDTGNNTVTVSATGATLSGDTQVTMTNGEWSDYIVSIKDAEGEVAITFTMKRGFLDDVKVVEEGAVAPAITATLNTAGYGTYCSKYPLGFSEATDYSAWYITGTSGETITFEKVTGSVKGGTGLFLKGENGTTGEIELTSVNSTNTLSNNMLVGTLAPTYFAQDAIYGLAGDIFKKNRAGTFPANKAYIQASSVGAVRAFTFVFVDPTTGITETRNVSAEEFGEVFNLAGQRMSKPQKGVNIINGKKVLVK